MEIPLPDPKKLLSSWMEWERGDVTPGRVMANLKTGGLPTLLESLTAEAAQVEAAQVEAAQVEAAQAAAKPGKARSSSKPGSTSNKRPAKGQVTLGA